MTGIETGTSAKYSCRWVTRCDCGEVKSVLPGDAKSGKTKSCGCLHNEAARERATKFKNSVRENKRLYGIYNGIKKRCYNKNEPRYKDYGMRGIKMCKEWLDDASGFDSFVEWSVLNGYNDSLTIDRIDVDGDYSPENCRWATMHEQQLNKRETRWVEYNGEKIQLYVLCNNLGISYDTTHDRLYKRGWTLERAISEPSERENSLLSKCKAAGLNYGTVRDRIFKLGWTEEQALSTGTVGRGANATTYSAKEVKKVCPVCGSEFSTIYKKRKYCSDKCSAASKRKRYKNRQIQHDSATKSSQNIVVSSLQTNNILV